MSEIIYPIVHCPDGAARVKLVRALMDMGCSWYGPVERVADPHLTHISILRHRSIVPAQDSDVLKLSDRGHWGHYMTMVNSPAQMLSYIKRAGIIPKS